MSRQIEDKIVRTGKVNWRQFKFLQKESFKEISKKQMDKLKASILSNDFIETFKCWQSGGKVYCLDGYHRCLALSELAAEGYQVPDEFTANFIQCKDMKDAAKKVLIYSSIYASVTDEGLYEFSHDFNLNFEEIKFEIDIPKLDLDRYEAGYVRDDGYNEEEDNVPEPPAEPTTKVGDLYLLGGKHRLLCGDSTKAEDVARLMDGCNVYDQLTDPPYNINFNYHGIDDKKTDDEYKTFCRNWFNSWKPKCRIFTPGPRNEKYYPEPLDRGVWIKRNATAGASVFHLRLAEPILFYGKYQTKRNTDIFDYSTGFTQELKEAQRASSVLDCHAPVKSMPLWLELIRMLESEIIVDCFMGNGTTLIACETIGRISYGLEIDPAYCDVIIERYKNLTGKEVKLIESVGRAANE